MDIKKNLKNHNLKIYLDNSGLDFPLLKNLLFENLGGENEIFFCVNKDNYEIEIESKQNFKINLDFINKLKKTQGIKKVTKKN